MIFPTDESLTIYKYHVSRIALALFLAQVSEEI